MTIKDLQRLVESQPDYSNSSSQELERLRGKEFWWWDSTEHKRKDITYKGDCCFNHIIGLPRKNGVRKPLFDYEKMLYRALMIPSYLNSYPKPRIKERNPYGPNYLSLRNQTNISPDNALYPFKVKHLWILKATGLGVTEFMLRFMAWLCFYNDDYRNSQMVIVTGPNQELAIKLIKRMKGLFTDGLGATFDTKETVLELNGCSIEAYPSNHIDAFRSLTNPKFILVDEGDFAPKFQQDEVRSVSERYIAKSDPYIVMVSTPNAPGGLFQRIQQEPLETCLYKKVTLDYVWGLDKIYSKTEIEKAKQSPSFPREYELQYLGIEGNVFSTQSIELCQKIEYNPGDIIPDAPKSMGIDPAYGSSNFAIVVTQLVDGKIQVVEASEWARPGFSEMVQKVWELKNKCNHISNIYVDASNPSFIQQLKKEFDEPFDDQYVRDKQAFCRKHNLHIENQMFIVPTPFSIENKRMLSNAKWLMDEREEDGSSLIAIHPTFDKLLISLRTATVQEWKLQKEETSFNDILDSFLMALQYYKRTK